MPPSVTDPSSAPLAAASATAAAAEWGLVVWAWHAALARAMRARGLARWTVADTVLVSPLFAGGTLAASAALGLTAVVVSAFGVCAVGKLY